MKYKLILVILTALSIGAFGGYTYATYSLPTPTDVQVRSFSASYSSLRNITEKGNEEAMILIYALMNNSIREMYKLYPDAPIHEKQMIYISFKGYADYILNNPLYKQPESEISEIVESLIKKHNKTLNTDSAKSAAPVS